MYVKSLDFCHSPIYVRHYQGHYTFIKYGEDVTSGLEEVRKQTCALQTSNDALWMCVRAHGVPQGSVIAMSSAGFGCHRICSSRVRVPCSRGPGMPMFADFSNFPDFRIRPNQPWFHPLRNTLHTIADFTAILFGMHCIGNARVS